MKTITIELTDEEYKQITASANGDWLPTNDYITIVLNKYELTRKVLEVTQKKLRDSEREAELYKHRYKIEIEKKQKPNKGQS